MPRPARIEPWLSSVELLAWLREARQRDAYRKRLAIWLTVIGPFYAHQVARMLGVSRQAVWLWIGQYNEAGPEGLARAGRGGRRWAYLSAAEEEALLTSFAERARRGAVMTAKQLLPEIRAAVGAEVSLGYVYKLLRRRGRRKLGPRHVEADPLVQEGFKRNVPPASPRR